MSGFWVVAAAAMMISPDDVAGSVAEGLADLSPQDSSLQFMLLPGVWLPRLNGRSSLGPIATSGDIELADQLDLNSTEPTVNVELAIRKRDVWEMNLSGMAFTTEASNRFIGDATFGTLALNDGDPFNSSFDISSFSAGLSLATFRPFAEGGGWAADLDNRTADGRYIADLRISPEFGFRYVDVDQSLRVPGGGEVLAGGEWLGVYGGFQLTLEYRPEQPLPLMKMLRMQGAVGVGPALGGDGGTMVQVRAGLTIQMTEQLGIMFGYRLLELDVENDDYKLRGGLQGLFLAGSIRF